MTVRLVCQEYAKLTVTVVQGHVPAVSYTLSYELQPQIAMVVNFLRSGCPAVQFLTGRKPMVDEVRAALNSLELPGETFNITPGCREKNLKQIVIWRNNGRFEED